MFEILIGLTPKTRSLRSNLCIHMIKFSLLRRHRLTVRTLPFQGGNRGSIPRGAAWYNSAPCFPVD